ncbi:MAG TPA: hypothetical protein PKH33_08275 [bacterium]|nr:hypothetical protein [bacterium]
MKKTFFILSILFTYAVIFAGTLSGMEISGTVWTVPAKKDDKASEKVALKPASGVVVKAVSIEGASLAEGKTDDKGVYKIELPEGKQTRILSAETDGGPIRTILFGKTNDIDPVTEALTWKIISADPANYTSAEFEFMTKELRALADGIGYPEGATAVGAMDYMIDVPDFNIALTDLTATYGSPGDSVGITEEAKTAMEDFIKAFNANDGAKIREMIFKPAKISIGNATLNEVDDVVREINELHKLFGNIKLQVKIASITVEKDRAEATAYETIAMGEPNDEERYVNSSWISINVLNKKNGKWALSERAIKKCTVHKAVIETDGRLDDWVGISPCYRRSPVSPEEDGITAVFFARDSQFLYWRVDLNMLMRIPLSVEPPRLGVPRGEFRLLFYGDEDDHNCDNLINIISNDFTSAASAIRVCAKDKDGKEKSDVHTYYKFAVGGRFIEGSVPLEDLFFLEDGLFCEATGKRRTRPGLPEEPYFGATRMELFF